MTTTVLSVRGEAQLAVLPDLVRLSTQLHSAWATKDEALADVADAQARLLADLVELGGVPRTAGTDLAPLTWLCHAVTTEPEHEADPVTGHYAPTGRVMAMLSVQVTVRELGRLDEISARLASHRGLQGHNVQWAVDAVNPAWRQVRAEAIAAAVRQGRDYAAALGGSLTSVEHVADAGLLGRNEGGHDTGWMGQEAAGRASSTSRRVPSLDPVPQVLRATIEARFVVTGVSLDAL